MIHTSSLSVNEIAKLLPKLKRLGVIEITPEFKIINMLPVSTGKYWVIARENEVVKILKEYENEKD